MLWNRRSIGVGLGLAGAALCVATGGVDAFAKPPKSKRHHRFKSAPAPARGKTPALGADGAADTTATSPVAGAAVQGAFRQDVVEAGALLAMSPGRALVLNSYRGLSLVDTTSPSAPRVLATVAIDGTGERMFLGNGEVAVVSDVAGASGSTTIVSSVVIGDSSLTVAGTAQTSGSLRDAARTGDDLTLVVGDGYSGVALPMVAANVKPTAAGVASGAAPNTTAGKPGVASSVAFYPWYGGAAHVARVRIGADGSPSLLGTADVTGSVLADALTGTEAVIAVQASSPNVYFATPNADGSLKDPSTNGGYTPPTVSFVRFADDASGAPTSTGSLDLADVTGVAALDRDGATLRALEYADSGEVVATYDLSGSAPAARDSIALGDWPSAWTFAGGAFVYGTTAWNYDATTTPPANPVFDPSGASAALSGITPNGGKTKAANGTTSGGAPGGSSSGTSGPTSALNVIDLRDPSHLVSGAALNLGAGWIASLVAIDGGVVGALDSSDGADGSTSVFRIDVSDPSVPGRAGAVTIPGYANLGPVVGDALLANGGTTDDSGAFVPSTQIVELTGGGLALGGSYSVSAWTSAAARDANLLGLASYDRLTLVDLSDESNPQVAGEVRFVVNVAGFAALDAQTGAVLATDYVGGGVEIRTVSLPAADPLNPLSTLKVATGDAQMFAAAPFLYVVTTDWSSGRASLAVVDATDPSNLSLRGSLDLASYPGQVFLKDGALLLLRQADSLFVENKRGHLKAAVDAFGRAPKAWLANGFSAALDVVDLSNPDAPRPARRLHLAWDDSGTAVLAGDSLYVPTYVDVTTPDGDDQYAYMVAEIDVTDPLHPAAGTPIDVPGDFVAAAGAPHQVLTADYAYDDSTGATSSSLHVVDLSLPWQTRVLATRTIDGWPDSTTVAGNYAYVVVELNADASPQAGPAASPSAQLLTLSLSDLSVAATADRSGGAYSGQTAGGCLFLRTWGWTGAIDVYSLAAPASPSFVESQSVAGNAGDIVVVGSRAYAPGGLYGVQSFDLSK